MNFGCDPRSGEASPFLSDLALEYMLPDAILRSIYDLSWKLKPVGVDRALEYMLPDAILRSIYDLSWKLKPVGVSTVCLDYQGMFSGTGSGSVGLILKVNFRWEK